MGLLDLLVPPACAGCGALGSVLCRQCIDGFEPPSSAGDRFVAPDAGAVVGEHLTLAIAAFAYGGALRRTLQRFKYAGVSRLAEPLAGAALPSLQRLLEITGRAPLAPVPLSALRARERGYNQAALLADRLARGAGAPMHPVLVRRRETTRQHRLDRSERLRNLADAFAVEEKGPPPRAVVLIDDILTTSATMEACASVLRAAGVSEVYGFAIAREV